MKNIRRAMQVWFFLPLALASAFLFFTPAGQGQQDLTCVDERHGCGGTIYTFSCASDICGNKTNPQCYICVTHE